MGKFDGRDKIPETFSPDDQIDLSWKDKSPLDNGPYIQAFAVVKSLLDSSTHFIIKCAFTPILPYPAAKCDAIFTTMNNF